MTMTNQDLRRLGRSQKNKSAMLEWLPNVKANEKARHKGHCKAHDRGHRQNIDLGRILIQS